MWTGATAPSASAQASAEYPRGTAGARALFTASLASAKLWSAEEPNLYTLTLELSRGGVVLGAESTRVGIRTVKACSCAGHRASPASRLDFKASTHKKGGGYPTRQRVIVVSSRRLRRSASS